MGRTKHKKIVEVNSLENVFSYKNGSRETDLRKYFGNNNKLVLEIGCGHGDYTLSLAAENPERNFVGIDIKGARIWTGAKIALNNKLKNAAFLMLNSEFLADFFVEEKIDEIIIPFPDPHMRRTSESRRLISPKFLQIYKKILAKDGIIHFKTDNQNLFDYAIEVLKSIDAKIFFSTDDLYNESTKPFYTAIQTKYEKHYLNEGRKIKYISFKF